MNDCTNCLNRDRCFVKGGYGDRCTNVAKGYVRGEWEDLPEQTNNNQQKGTEPWIKSISS